MNIYDRCFMFAYEHWSIKELEKSAEKIADICKSYGAENEDKSLGLMSENDLDEVIFRSEKAAVSCRKIKEIRAMNDEVLIESDEENKNAFHDTSAEIRVEFDGKILKIMTPYTFKNKYEKANHQANYLLQLYVRNALIRWQKENSVDLFHALTPPLILEIKRKTLSKTRSVADNDNIENGRITNTIMNVLGVSDNWHNMSLYSCVEPVNDPDDGGMEFIIAEKETFFAHHGML